MTDIENHMVDGPVKEYEGDRTEEDVQAEMTRIIESLDNDDLADMQNNHASPDFDIDYWDGVRALVAQDEVTIEQLAGVMSLLRDELRRQIREDAEANA